MKRILVSVLLTVVLIPGVVSARTSLADLEQQIDNLTNSVDNLTDRVDALEAGGVPGPVPAQNVIVVALDGSGDYTSPLTAMQAITDASSTKPYTIQIRPGVYDIGASVLQMKSYVTVEGSGQQSTTIKGNVYSPNAGLVSAASTSDAEIRSLTVQNGNVDIAVAIRISDGSLVINDVTATSASTRQGGGILCQNSTLSLSNVTAQGSNQNQPYISYGIRTDHCLATMINIVASGNSHAIDNNSSDVVMTHVTAIAPQGEAGVENQSSTVMMTDVIASASGDVISIYGVLNIDNPSVSMNNVTASASGQSGAQEAIGILNSGTNSASSVSMIDVAATASGAMSMNAGVTNESQITATMTDVTATASGGESAFAVQNRYASSVEMTRITASAINGTSISAGIWGRQSNVNINDSVVSGAYSLYAESFIHYVTNTKLNGIAFISQNLICTGATDFNDNPLDSHCQP